MRHTEAGFYDADRLVEVEGQPAFRATLRYDDPAHPNEWTQQGRLHGDNPANELTIEREVGANHIVLRFTQADKLSIVLDRRYAGGAIVSEVMSDPTSADPDASDTWTRDADRALLQYSHDDRFEDVGSAFFTETYSDGCQPFERYFPWLFHVPSRDGIDYRL